MSKLLPVAIFAVVVAVAIGGAIYAPVGDGEADSGSPVESLADAVAAGDVEAASRYLESGDDPDEPRVNSFTPLMRAAIRDDVAMIRLLVDAGASLDARTPGELSVWHVAAQADSPAAIQALIEFDVDLGQRSLNGMNTLEHAADAGAVDVIAVIAGAGVDLNAPSEIITQGHGYPVDVGSTALSIAARAGHVETVERLLAVGADVDARSELGQTALIQAIATDQSPEVVRVLLEAGASLEVRATCGRRCGSGEDLDALGWARRVGDPEVIALVEAALTSG